MWQKDPKILADHLLLTSLQRDKYWKRILIVDDDPGVANTFKVGIENTSKSIAVHTHNGPRKALLDFEPNFWSSINWY